MTNAVLHGRGLTGHRLRFAEPVRALTELPFLLAAIAAIAAYALARWIDASGLWPDAVTQGAARAAMAAAGHADPSALLVIYPPLPVLLLLATDPIGRLCDLSPVVLLDALLAGGFAAAYAAASARARVSQPTILLLSVLLWLNPLTIAAIARGPETLLLIGGVWTLVRGMFGTRITTGVNNMIVLTLSLPMLAVTGMQGAVIALGAIPFLLFAVPRDLVGRHYVSVYVVLLFPLAFAALSGVILSMILLDDPLAFASSPGIVPHAGDGPWPITAATAAAATMGVLAIAAGLIFRAGLRRSLQQCAGAVSAIMALSVMVSTAALHLGLVDALIPCIGAIAALSIHWPVEPKRSRSVAILLLAGLIVAACLPLIAGGRRSPALDGAFLGERKDPGDLALGRFLQGRNDVLIDAAAHPAVVVARGGAHGLVTDRSPAFGLSMRARDVTTTAVAVHEHRAGEDDDAVSQTLPRLFETGPAGFALVYDSAGWRVWQRHFGRAAP